MSCPWKALHPLIRLFGRFGNGGHDMSCPYNHLEQNHYQKMKARQFDIGALSFFVELRGETAR